VKQDRAGSLGRQATRDVEALDMLRYYRWLTQAAPGQYVNNRLPLPTVNVSGVGNARQTSFLLDPLFISQAANWNNATSTVFPYTGPTFGTPWMLRVSLPRFGFAPNVATNYPNVGMTLSQAEAIFRLRDEVVFRRLVTDPKGRPELQPAAGSATRVEAGGAAALADDVGHEVEGEYSWAVMVTPSEMEAAYEYPGSVPGPQPYNYALDANFAPYRRHFHVAVIVFHGRDFSIPATLTDPAVGERVARAAAMFGNAMELQAADAAGLTVGEWMMVSGVRQPASDDGLRVIENIWYRIVGIGRVDGDHVLVRLEGPEWNPNMYVGGTAWVTVVPNVVGVYQRTIELDVTSLQSD
jgi:hypothetical protein